MSDAYKVVLSGSAITKADLLTVAALDTKSEDDMAQVRTSVTTIEGSATQVLAGAIKSSMDDEADSMEFQADGLIASGAFQIGGEIAGYVGSKIKYDSKINKVSDELEGVNSWNSRLNDLEQNKPAPVKLGLRAPGDEDMFQLDNLGVRQQEAAQDAEVQDKISRIRRPDITQKYDANEFDDGLTAGYESRNADPDKTYKNLRKQVDSQKKSLESRQQSLESDKSNFQQRFGRVSQAAGSMVQGGLQTAAAQQKRYEAEQDMLKQAAQFLVDSLSRVWNATNKAIDTVVGAAQAAFQAMAGIAENNRV